MKKVFVLIIVTLFMVAGNVAAANLNGVWTGIMYCSDDFGDSGEPFTVRVVQEGDFFQTYNPEYEDEHCGGVIDGNKISMTCRDESRETPSRPLTSVTFAYGELKGRTLYIINHVPADARTCKGTATQD